MPRIICKFPVPLNTLRFNVDMPEGAEILTVQLQHGEPVMWAIAISTRQKVKRTFFLGMTGETIVGDLGKYIGTFQHFDLSYHLFEIGG